MPISPKLTNSVASEPTIEDQPWISAGRIVIRAGQRARDWVKNTPMVMRTLAFLVLAAASSSTLLRGEDSVSPDKQVKPQFQPRNPRYQIRPADVIEISFYPAAELNQTLSVQPDGYITLREAGDLHVLGKTIPELKEAIASAYRDMLHDPVITIVLRDFERPHFTVGGLVGRPGKYDLRADTTASEAIAVAGGVTEKAKHSQVLLFRRVSDEWVEAKQLDLKAIYKGKLQEDIHLRPGDMLFVPQNKISKIKEYLPVWSVGTFMNPAAF